MITIQDTKVKGSIRIEIFDKVTGDYTFEYLDTEQVLDVIEEMIKCIKTSGDI